MPTVYKLFLMWPSSGINRHGMMLTSLRRGENGYLPYYIGLKSVSPPQRPFLAFSNISSARSFACMLLDDCAVCLKIQVEAYEQLDNLMPPWWMEEVYRLPEGTVLINEFTMPKKAAFEPEFIVARGHTISDQLVQDMTRLARISWEAWQ